jgi:hypothetical protein
MNRETCEETVTGTVCVSFVNSPMLNIKYGAGALGAGAVLRCRVRLPQNDAAPCGSGSAILLERTINGLE